MLNKSHTLFATSAIAFGTTTMVVGVVANIHPITSVVAIGIGVSQVLYGVALLTKRPTLRYWALICLGTAGIIYGVGLLTRPHFFTGRHTSAWA